MSQEPGAGRGSIIRNRDISNNRWKRGTLAATWHYYQKGGTLAGARGWGQEGGTLPEIGTLVINQKGGTLAVTWHWCLEWGTLGRTRGSGTGRGDITKDWDINKSLKKGDINQAEKTDTRDINMDQEANTLRGEGSHPWPGEMDLSAATSTKLN